LLFLHWFPCLHGGRSGFFSLLHAANEGDVNAQVDLGYAYATGSGVQQDCNQAAYWWKKASAKGHADAQYNMGCLHEKGLGVPFDRFKAAKEYSMKVER
jgi:TPR repeat protein